MYGGCHRARPWARTARTCRMATATEEVEWWLGVVWKAGGTDLHLAVGAPPLGRVDGQLEPIEGEGALDAERVSTLVHSFLAAIGVSLDDRDDVDFGLTWRNTARVRGNVYRERGSVALAMRLIPLAIPSLADLGMPPVVETFAHAPSGLVIVTGPTGSGKSTTLASMIDCDQPHAALPRHHHRGPDRVRARAPPGDDQPARDRHRRRRTSTARLRSALREDPDVVLVGEMRDLESIQAALTHRRDRPPRARHPAHQRHRPGDRPHHRRLPRRPPRPDPGAAGVARCRP